MKTFLGAMLIAVIMFGALQIAQPARANEGIPVVCQISPPPYCPYNGYICYEALNCYCYGVQPPYLMCVRNL
jgi:hypothetical protein